ncbi:alpha/beta hydrolase [Longitalea luteola]|uniref:alpha/beta hydrolase n=1 Tax=Longitalea luteola TaxID=2812563 RepID=UPI001A95B52B|nr:alpha/beta hydrolase-fold protein [Longitalea luteola]
MNTMLRQLLLVMVLKLLICTASAQPVGMNLYPLTLPYGKVMDWHSAIVNDSFRIYVYFPPGYDSSHCSYPVLFLTDGDWSFTAAVNAFGSLKQDYRIVEPVIVAIGYGHRPNRRDRDLDPEKGGYAFLEALKKEVIPWTNAHLKVNDNRALYGYSLGGKFATFALFNEPELFTSVLIGAPAEGGRHLLPAAHRYKTNAVRITSKVFLATGEYERETVANIKHFEQYLQSQSPSIPVTTWVAPAMNHGAAIPAVLQEAIKVTYAEINKEIEVSGKLLKTYSGTYIDSANNEKFRLFVKNRALYIMLHGYTADFPFQLRATSKNTFSLREYERIAFTFSGNRLTVMWPDGHESKYLKVKNGNRN